MKCCLSRRNWFMASSALAALVVGTGGAFAETVSTEYAEIIDEIIVTARKRSEEEVAAPLAVSTFTQYDIAEAGIVDLQDIALHTPGFSFREGFGRLFSEGNNRPVIRGMSSVLGEANAGFFIDGVYISGPVSTFDLTNLARVEVVRGPQSALFGRGAFGGAVNFVTRRPTQENEGRVEASLGSHGKTVVNAYLSGGLSETISGEVNARFDKRASIYNNAATGEKDLGAQKSFRIGGKLNIDVNEKLNVYLHGGWAADRDEGYAFAQWNGGDAREDGISSGQSNCYDPSVFMSMFGMNFTTNQSRGYYCGEIAMPATFYSDFGGLNSVDRNTWNIIGDITYQLGGGATLKSLTGYTNVNYSQAELPAIYAGASTVWEDGSHNYFSQELRFESDTSQRLRTMAGAYYFRSNTGDMVNVAFDPLTSSLADIDTSLIENGAYTENLAAFIAFDYDISNQLTLTAEARYQDEKKVLAGGAYDGDHSISFDAFLPRLAVRYKASDALTLYATVAKGNKPGGFNDDFYTLALDAEDRSYWRDLGRGIFDESSVWSYEAGLKARPNENWQINASLFYLNWAGQQLTQSDALRKAGSSRQTTVTFITNAGKSEVKGFEIDASFEAAEGLEFRLSYAYNHATFSDYLDENWRDLQDTNGWYTGQAIAAVIFPGGDVSLPPSLLPDGVILDPEKSPIDADGDGAPDRFFVIDTVDPEGQVKGNSLPQSPSHQASVSATYRTEFSDQLFGFIRTDYLYESKRYVQAANLAWIGDSHKVNIRFGVEKDNWSLTAWVDNLTKDDTPEVVTRYADFGNVLMIPSQVRAGSRYTFARDFMVTAPAIRSFGITLNYAY